MFEFNKKEGEGMGVSARIREGIVSVGEREVGEEGEEGEGKK